MGLLATLLGPFADRAANSSPVLLAGVGFFVLLSLAVVLNVLRQLLFKNPNQPPVVFHWFPLVGSTVTYGMDPIAFFQSCQDKVCRARRCVPA
jgi:sterol 14-demethylase